ncbi:MAG: AAA family ATPase [Candidatus Paracaedibacteraceae bacterium]|nr:AAA family ATPase [Candidatus Paracaedibacteraceae bacterium]
MAPKTLSYEQVALPKFSIKPEDLTCPPNPVTYFDLTSHARAGTAISTGLKMRRYGANVFVIGGDRSARMLATMQYLEDYIKSIPPCGDWVYLNNFETNYQPIPFQLPRGQSLKLKRTLNELIEATIDLFNTTLTSGVFINEVNALTAELDHHIQSQLEEVQKTAITKGLRVETTNDEFTITTLEENTGGKSTKAKVAPEDLQSIREQLAQISSLAHFQGRELTQKIQALKIAEAEKTLKPLLAPFRKAYDKYLGKWIDSLKDDILNHIDYFILDEGDPTTIEELRNRYAVNVLVNNKEAMHAPLILDPAPTYESIFGCIKYKTSPSGYATDFTMIRPGNLHRANGGILVLRAEAIAQDPSLWMALKTALRDRQILIEEFHRENALPMLDAPDPKPVPLDIQIFLVGAPLWFYNFFYLDPEFKTYFKVKADIEPDLPANSHNISVCTRLFRQISLKTSGKDLDHGAIQCLLGYSSRWINNREWLSSKFELMTDIINEANELAIEEASPITKASHIKESIIHRRLRTCGVEDRTHREIERDVVLIETHGKKLGIVNGLSVLSTGDHYYGIPNRISARTFAGDKGIINIERLIEMSGPIQQKGAMILDGFLNGKFSQKHPVSFSCSLTFEQSYEEIEGDSASVAELIAILSSLSKVRIRQDMAVTGSINQFGEIQAVGGLNHKIEGFFRVCKFRGFTSTQGVIIPASNIEHIVLRDEISDAVRDGKFHIWAVSTIDEAIGLLMSTDAGKPDKNGKYPKESLYGLVQEQLTVFSKSLEKR